MEPRHRGPRRHAGAYQDHADGDLAAYPGPEGRTRAGNVAGDLPDRASRTSAPARDRAAVCGRYPLKKQNRPRSDPRPAWCISLVRAAPPPAKLSVRLDVDVLGFRQEEEADHRGD